MSAFTCKNYPIGKAPARIELLGDKTKRSEPAQHVIEFPGGAIELTRTTQGEYWAHIIVHQGYVLDDGSTRETAAGRVVDSRVASVNGSFPIPRAEGLTQIAVLIRAVKPEPPTAPPEGGLFA